MTGHDQTGQNQTLHQHWTDEEFLDAVYGLREVDEFARACSSCRQRWSEMHQRRSELGFEPELSSEFLAAQRRKIYERIERPEPKSLRWVPALVAAGLAMAGVFVYQTPRSITDSPKPAEISDAQAFADVAEAYTDLYSMDQFFEPSAATPIQSLFEADTTVNGREGRAR